MKKLIILICLLFCSVAFAKDKCANRPQNIIREVNATGGTTTYLYTFNPLDTDMMVSLRFRGYYEEILFMPFSFESKNLEKEIVCKDKKFNEGLVVVSSKNDYYLFKPKMIEISYACGDYTKDNKDNYGTMTFVLDYQVFNKRISAVKKPDIFFQYNGMVKTYNLNDQRRKDLSKLIYWAKICLEEDYEGSNE